MSLCVLLSFGCQNKGVAANDVVNHKKNNEVDTVKNACTLFYLWSPRMVLSAQHADAVVNAARAAHLKVRVLHPSDIRKAELIATFAYLEKAHPKSAESLLRSKAFSIVASAGRKNHQEEVLTVTTVVHFPTVWVEKQNFHGTNLRSTRVVGVMPAPYWKHAIDKMKKQAQCQRM